MNEWRRLLEQTQYKAKTPSTLAVDFIAEEEESEALCEDPQVEAETETEIVHLDLDWISPTVKLQKKIENIPDKFGFKIGEAADYIGVKQYVLRYWESEFDRLKPKKSKNGQRMYTKKDVETALLIQKLLHDDRFSIEGARSALTQLKKQVRETVKAQKEAAKPTPAMTKAPEIPEAKTEEAKPTEVKTVEDHLLAFSAEEKSPNDDPRSLSEAVASAERLLESIRQTREGLEL